jgi:hypothetical protein
MKCFLANGADQFYFYLTVKLLRAAIDKYPKWENVPGTDRF